MQGSWMHVLFKTQTQLNFGKNMIWKSQNVVAGKDKLAVRVCAREKQAISPCIKQNGFQDLAKNYSVEKHLHLLGAHNLTFSLSCVCGERNKEGLPLERAPDSGSN